MIHVRNGHARCGEHADSAGDPAAAAGKQLYCFSGATNTPAPELTATPNIEITPTPEPQETAAAVTTYKTLRRGDRGQEVVSMQQALVALGYLKGASDGNFGTGTKDGG